MAESKAPPPVNAQMARVVMVLMAAIVLLLVFNVHTPDASAHEEAGATDADEVTQLRREIGDIKRKLAERIGTQRRASHESATRLQRLMQSQTYESPSPPTEEDIATTVDTAATTEGEVEDNLPPPPGEKVDIDGTHITGSWSPELEKIQMDLVARLAGSETSKREWMSRLRRADAPGDGPHDQTIRKQLQAAKRCDSLQKNVDWTRGDLLRELKYFLKHVYPNRPIKTNTYGMRLSHTFGAWFMVRWLKPEYILESGVHKGQSTWLMRQAAPKAKIISMDPRTDMIYWDKNAKYYTGKGIVKPGYDVNDFVDFADMDWSFISDKSRTLVLIDDHQNTFKRVKLCKERGFKHVFIDDNWSPLQGDNYSAKQVCDETGGLAYRRPNFPSTLVLACDNFHMSDVFLTMEEHTKNREFLLGAVKVYYESPPVLFVPAHMEHTKFGHKPSKDKSPVQYVLPRPSNTLLTTMMEYTIAPPIVQSRAEFEEVGLGTQPHFEFYNYANLGYIELYQ